MTALDIIFLLLVGLGLFTGLRRGFVYAVLSLGTWLLVVLALWVLHGPLAGALEGAVGTTSGAYVLAFVLIFAIVLIGGKLVVKKASGGVRRSFVGPADRLLGAGFGALKGLVFVTLFYMAFSFIYDTLWGREAARPRWIADAMTYPLVHGTANTFVDLVEARRRAQAEGPDGNRAAANKAAPKAK
ncbi:MAG TPA: CvpA family protein [Allosphingosinicella sp.]|jgi:membrane protein required for colicin V production